MASQAYSVLMSIYLKENPAYLRASLDSIINQTIPPAEIVMVKDGPLTKELDSVLAEYDRRYPGIFSFIAYEENHGLGYALHRGIVACTNDIVARMDTDDIARSDRMEKQLKAIQDGLDMVGSQVIEFVESPDKPIARTDLPEGLNNIIACSKRRNPFRHPPMTFKRSKVLKAGNYSSEYLYFEDWDLFNRMLAAGCRAENLHETLVAMRVSPDFYERRGGLGYLAHVWKFKSAQLRIGYFTVVDFLISFLPQLIVCLMPNCLRGFVYTNMLRRSDD